MNNVKIVIASDHGGFQYKNVIAREILNCGYQLKDLGTFTAAASDYPDHAQTVAEALQKNEASKGILICGSGAGVSVAANKFKGIRAAVCHDTYTAHQCVEHDDVNVLCIGQRVVGIELAREIVFAFLTASFSSEERHVRRLKKVLELERKNMV